MGAAAGKHARRGAPGERDQGLEGARHRHQADALRAVRLSATGGSSNKHTGVGGRAKAAAAQAVGRRWPVSERIWGAV